MKSFVKNYLITSSRAHALYYVSITVANFDVIEYHTFYTWSDYTSPLFF